MDRYQEAMFDDGFDEAEGTTSSFDEYDEADEMDAGDEGDEMDAGEEMDAGDEFDQGDEADEADEGDGFEAYDEFDEGERFEEVEDDSMDEMLAFALGAEDSDEFLKRIAKNAGRFLWRNRRAIVRGIGKVAPMIPGVGTAIGGVANVVGQLMADEASEEEALDAFAEYAVRSPEALPLVAGLAARAVLGRQAARLPMAARRQAIRTIRRATSQLVQRRGPTAIRVLPRVARSVRRTATTRRTPPHLRSQVVAGAVRRLARRPHLRRQLTRPVARGQQILSRVRTAQGRYGRYSGLSHPRSGSFGTYGGGTYSGGSHGGRRSIVIRGPVHITVRPS